MILNILRYIILNLLRYSVFIHNISIFGSFPYLLYICTSLLFMHFSLDNDIRKNYIMGQNVSVGNLYKEKIWVKYDVEKKYVKVEDFKAKLEVEVSGVEVGPDISSRREYDWKKIEVKFTPINPGDYKYKKEETKNAYLTIITDGGKVVCNTWYVDKDYSWLVTEDLELRRARRRNPLELRNDADKDSD